MKLLHCNDQPGVHATSWYRANTTLPAFEPLTGPVDCDTCVIGAGYTGLAAARDLADAGLDVLVLEAHRVGWGASGRNGGQLGTGFNVSQSALEAQLGDARAMQLWNLAEAGKAMARELLRDRTHGGRDPARREVVGATGFSTKGGLGAGLDYTPGIISALHRTRFIKSARREMEHLRRQYGYRDLEWLDKRTIRQQIDSADYQAGVLDLGAGHLNPLAMAAALARTAVAAGAVIHERSEALHIASSGKTDTRQQFRIRTSRGDVNARQLIVACNGYVDGLLPELAGLIMPINNYLVVTEPLGALAGSLLPDNHAVADSRFVVNYFRRTADDRLLFGGGESYGYRFPPDLQRNVRRAMLGIFPHLANARIDDAWGGTLAISRSRFPVVRRVRPGLFTGAGYSGHGVALALIAGRVMAEAIRGDDERLSWLEQVPARRFPGGVRARPVLLGAAMTVSRWLDRW